MLYFTKDEAKRLIGIVKRGAALAKRFVNKGPARGELNFLSIHVFRNGVPLFFTIHTTSLYPSVNINRDALREDLCGAP